MPSGPGLLDSRLGASSVARTLRRLRSECVHLPMALQSSRKNLGLPFDSTKTDALATEGTTRIAPCELQQDHGMAMPRPTSGGPYRADDPCPGNPSSRRHPDRSALLARRQADHLHREDRAMLAPFGRSIETNRPSARPGVMACPRDGPHLDVGLCPTFEVTVHEWPPESLSHGGRHLWSETDGLLTRRE